jgi:hypothetical protein
MPRYETPAERYRRLAEEALDLARNFPHGEHSDALVQMAQVWERLGDTYADGTVLHSPSGGSRSTRHATATASPARRRQEGVGLPTEATIGYAT